MQRQFWVLLGCWVLLGSCNRTDRTPDVSHIKTKVSLARFDQALFALDTAQLATGLDSLATNFSGFYPEYMQFILGVSGDPSDSTTQRTVRQFIGAYRPIQDSLQLRFADTRNLEKELQTSFRYLLYYFPSYQSGTITLFTGPLDAPGVATVRSGTAVGLQQFAGNGFFAYQSADLQTLYPGYLSRRFAPQYIVPGVIKAIAEDLFPPRTAELPLIEQMIERGKYWYLASLLLPYHADSLITGYTQQQLAWCKDNEGLIWSHLVKNEDLNSLNPVVIQTYLGEAPFTQGLSQEYSPGNLGAWVGWQIVKKYADAHSEMHPSDIMKTPPATLLEQAKYKPK
ncbi:MAG: hypothetical protein EB101_02250 [Chitinophagia bacterium]|nr:hypothetical protein [Chitinophagia bacterium]